MRNYITISWLCKIGMILLCGTVPAAAQHPAYQQFTTADGLPSNEIHDITQDSTGTLWLATDHGLCAYDGHAFKTYTASDGLVDNTIFRLVHDQRGRLWMTSFSGGLCYYQDGIITEPKANSSIVELLGPSFVKHLHVDQNDVIWFTSDFFNRYYKVHPGGRIDSLRLSGRGTQDGALGIIELADGAFILCLSPQPESFNLHGRHELISDKHGRYLTNWSPDMGIYVTHTRRRNGELLLTRDKIIARLSADSLLALDTVSHTVNDLMEDADGALWVAGANGLQWFRHGDLRREPRTLFNNQKVSAVFQDDEANIWVATLRNGLYFLPSTGVFRLETQGSDAEIVALAAAGDTLVISDARNRVKLYTIAGGAPHYRRTFDPGRQAQQSEPTPKYLHLHGDTLFSGHKNLSLVSGRQRVLKSEVQSVSYLSGAHTPDGGLLSSGRGFLKIKEGKTVLYSEQIKFRKRTHKAYQDQNGNIWLGTLQGLYRWTNDSLTAIGSRHPLLRGRIDDIGQTADGTLWFAGKGLGLAILPAGSRRDTLIHLTREDGINSDLCQQLCIDHQREAVWLTSNQGLNCITRAPDGRYVARDFSTGYGLPKEQINDIVVAQNLLVLATRTAVYYFDPDSLLTRPMPPRISIRQILSNDRPLGLAAAYSLEDDQNAIEVRFNGNSFRHTSKTLYRYQLRGYDRSFVQTLNRSARYADLPAGDYKFVVQAANADGVWSPQPASISISIAPHFSETAWFRTALFVVAIALLSGAILLLLRRQKRIEAGKRRLLELEYRALRMQMNPHFVFNALNSVQHLINSNRAPVASTFLVHLSQLIRRLVKLSDHRSVPLREELAGLHDYLALEKMRFRDKFEFEVHTSAAHALDEYYIAPMLLQPLVENAIMHGIQPKHGKGLIRIDVETSENGLICKISDNGIGRANAAQHSKKRTTQHTSSALNNINERIALINEFDASTYRLELEDIRDDNMQVCGTRASLYLTYDS